MCKVPSNLLHCVFLPQLESTNPTQPLTGNYLDPFANSSEGFLDTLGEADMYRNQYDTDVTVWSPQGRLHQVEYAMEVVNQVGGGLIF